MKLKILLLTLFAGLLNMQASTATPPDKTTGEINRLVDELANETYKVKTYYAGQKNKIYQKISQIDQQLKKAKSPAEKIDLLLEKDRCQTTLKALDNSERVNIQKIRYIKGLSIIKLLYE